MGIMIRENKDKYLKCKENVKNEKNILRNETQP